MLPKISDTTNFSIFNSIQQTSQFLCAKPFERGVEKSFEVFEVLKIFEKNCNLYV